MCHLGYQLRFPNCSGPLPFETLETLRHGLSPRTTTVLCFGTVSKLFRANSLLPTSYRDRLAAAIGHVPSRVRIYPATPRIADAAIDGCVCRTALIVVPDCFVADTGDTFCFLVDCRPILQGFLCFKAASGTIRAASVLDELNREAPLGLCASIDGIVSGEVMLCRTVRTGLCCPISSS